MMFLNLWIVFVWNAPNFGEIGVKPIILCTANIGRGRRIKRDFYKDQPYLFR